jgi:hypothetical protein
VVRLTFPAEGVGMLEFPGARSDGRPTDAAGDVDVPDGVDVGLHATGAVSWRRAHSSTVGLHITYDDGRPSPPPTQSHGWIGTGRSRQHSLDLSFLTDLPSTVITRLTVESTVDARTFGAVGHLAPGLRWLILSGSDLDDLVLSTVAALTGLTGLQTFGNRFTDEGVQQLGALKELQSLYLEEETLSAKAFGFASGLPQLRRLGLQDVAITEAELAALRARLPGVDVG